MFRGRRRQPLDLVIVGDGPLGRHDWLNVAVAAPALRLAQGGSADRQVFALAGSAAELSWRGGRIVITGATPDDRADLEGLAALLGGRLEPSG